MILVVFYPSNYDNPHVIEFTNNGTTEAISLVQFSENDYQVNLKKKDFFTNLVIILREVNII
jgi:hypothetical protein